MDSGGLFAINEAVKTASVFEVSISILGDAAVGKSSITAAFNERPFSSRSKPTFGYDISTKFFDHPDGNKIHFKIFDTAGQERFAQMLPNYIRNADAIMVVYDVTNRATFDHVDKWLFFVNNHMPYDTPVIIVGNKIDMDEEREVKTEEGQAKAERCNLLFKEASAKTGQCVVDVFHELSTFLRNRRICSLFHGEKVPLSHMAIKLSDNSSSSEGCPIKKTPCCLS